MANPLPKPGFRTIAAAIRQEIEEGRYPPASVLPPEPELAQRHGVSRSLVNRALGMLAAEGVVRPRQGRGTVVTWLPSAVHLTALGSRAFQEGSDSDSAFDSAVAVLGLEPQREITAERVQAPADVADAYALGKVRCLFRQRRLLASGIPVLVSGSWSPLDFAGNTVSEEEHEPVVNGGVMGAGARLGYKATVASERIVPSRLPTAAEASALEISPDRAVTEILAIGRTAEGRCVEVTVTVVPARDLVIEHTFSLLPEGDSE
ncbi:GntR family transcriptional regulator [Streptomyces sp. SAJ15]|uniref:GntR family transcriptional regulator n=1 Tax=Streptomyces sp. SAJ15 TaxID=2011095 RepID=UPI0011868D41|nr:GntR family transcriptional regulator [Streptomyces sp. SAJ15]TVL88481.1 hypothetical protein CD790_31045 [Streptomyces sp. SAJ15]